MSSDFVDIRILDNFYQTSSFYPMPVVLVSTVAETGQTNLGPYSLCFPYGIAGEHSMMLISRGSSNTAQNIERTGVCAINFVSDSKKFMRNCVTLGYPGETTEEKMANSVFALQPSARRESEREPGVQYPDIVQEAVQVFECTLDRRFPHKTEDTTKEQEYRFVLRLDKILLKPQWRDALLMGKGFPKLPIDYGYRNNTRFWFSRHSRPYAVPIPKSKGVSLDTVQYAAQRYDPEVSWQDEACAKMVKVPRIFLNQAVAACVEAAKEEGVTEITPEFVEKIRDKRNKERGG